MSGVDFLAQRFLAVVAELGQARGQLDAVRAVVGHARLVSPSRSMSVYVVDVERALGLTDEPEPRIIGISDTTHSPTTGGTT